jgi:hypothetical protein
MGIAYNRPTKVVWRRLGNKSWNDWWVAKYGASIPREGSYEEHVSFVNYDLANNGHPTLQLTDREGVAEISITHEDNLHGIVNLLRYHGFEIEP